jgi:hypothetical protein
MLKSGEKYYVLEVLRGRFPFTELKERIIDMKQRYGRISLVIEESAISIGLIQSLEEKKDQCRPRQARKGQESSGDFPDRPV